ncbi:tripartite tricarboxylate transporter TctB family protein [Pseudonocardia cypriaca]|uniref:Putative tricarboxylic transport membrane protein n=1 Tax=Pseudonocardia cypriaca TaxID=882449 RepID=A0A543FX33_9PSEU|nr:tripartite tricarboxylate transporter TctB family protein [Pseudonocardia cypriaca]TQM38324.1 putative tricarboxylic transport membrane protein [Pseudonocardia cypriaca]
MTADPTAAPTGIPWRHDLVSGLLAAVLGAAVVLHVRTFPELPDGQPGPALFPSIVGGLLVLFGLVLVVRAVLARGEPAADPDAGITGRGRLRALAVLGLVVGYVLLAETLGFLLTMGVLLFLLMWLLGARPLVAVLAAAATTGFILLVFEELLLVPLPQGLFG